MPRLDRREDRQVKELIQERNQRILDLEGDVDGLRDRLRRLEVENAGLKAHRWRTCATCGTGWLEQNGETGEWYCAAGNACAPNGFAYWCPKEVKNG